MSLRYSRGMLRTKAVERETAPHTQERSNLAAKVHRSIFGPCLASRGLGNIGSLIVRTVRCSLRLPNQTSTCASYTGKKGRKDASDDRFGIRALSESRNEVRIYFDSRDEAKLLSTRLQSLYLQERLTNATDDSRPLCDSTILSERHCFYFDGTS
jgi:hypothetical protein